MGMPYFEMMERERGRCPRQHTSEIDFCCIYHDLVILFEAEPNFLVSTYEIDCCMKVIVSEKGRKLQED